MQSNMPSEVSAPEPGPGAVRSPMCGPEQACGPLRGRGRGQAAVLRRAPWVPEQRLLCGGPASSARDRGGGAEGEGGAPTFAHACRRPSVRFCSFSLAEMGDGAVRPLPGRRGQCHGAAYFCIWNRKSRRLMFLAASSLLHSTESTMGSGT